jgi:hypothetical protein
MQHAHALRAPLACALALAAASMINAPVALAAAPRISGTPVTSITVGQAWAFQPTASDADGNKLTFSIVNKPGFASFSSTTGRVSGTPFAEHARTWSNIVIAVSDGTSQVSLPAFSLVVKPNANKSPTITGTPPTTATVGTAYSFQPTAKDPEGKTLTFSIRSKPAWATFSTSTGKLSGTPVAASVGTYGNIMIIVSDGVTSASLGSFSITVAAAAGGGGGTSNSPPTISGTPLTSVAVGQTYTFQPTAKDANSDPLTFAITNKPAWATFSTSTGKLSGTPAAANVGTTSNIVIGVSDGKASASLSGFSVAVTQIGTGAATLNWTPPIRNTDGSVLTNLAGYRISYGQSATALTQTLQISNPGISSYVIDSLSPGTWYFGLKAYTSAGGESPLSNIASKTVQ